ncbi:EAL domain-containing protein [Marinobacter sp. R17]|uniref:putative bifunctional diguanylate cyclase/phosphodiesterase n=1 Tax=Marinobacter sp. R17 TaxID=2484250 RepID=UPI000F4C9444|nr:EAL domain-containing protein [Marinobacter sp. R17]ROU00889.1 EAL domain-containing protein [Marinobacter sp. R17]
MHNETSRWYTGLMRVVVSPALPAVLLLTFIVLATVLWQGIERQVRHQMELTLDAEATALSRELASDFTAHVHALRRMAERRAASPNMPREIWQEDAEHYLRDFRHYQAIEWIAPDYRIRWVAPLAGNENVVGFNVAFNAERLASLKQAARTGVADFSGIIELRQGGTGIVIYAPIVDDEGGRHGFIAGVFRMEGLAEALITPRIHDNFQVDIEEDGQVRYTNKPDSPIAGRLSQEATLSVPGLAWTLRITPTREWTTDHQGIWPDLALVSFLILGLLISLLVWLTQAVMRRNRALEHARSALENEIYQRESVQQDLARIESTDSLTGLANRRFFVEDLTHTLAIADRQYRQVALIMLDLDRFQILNDTLGHQFGDELLIKVAERLNQLSSERVLVAYSSGDEFMICQQHIDDIDDVIALLGQIKQCFVDPFEVQEQSHQITATMGVAIYPQSGLDADILLRNADVALYRAKENGRNHYQFYTEGMQDREVRRLELDKDLNRALSEDQLVLHFQPQLDLATQQIGSVEALIRWQHPTRGLLPPVDFIPLAEESGRITDIGRWVAMAACRQLAAWQGGPFDHLRIAINLSGRELEDRDLVSNIERALRDNNVTADKLEVELTEEIFIDNLEHNLDQLKRLHQIGVHLAIDDFGTGYSSLAYLRDFPVDLLKIDRSFITRVTERHDDAIITRAVINLAHNLGIQVAAEGIETEAQLNFLNTHRCDLAQGYLIGRPMPASELEALVSRGFQLPNPLHQPD